MLARLRSLIRMLTARDRFEQEMRDEVRFHIDARVDDLLRTGLNRAEAVRRARLEFGTVDAIKDDCRQARGVRWLDEFAGDLRYAIRLMKKTPGLTAAAMLSLALGIGANTAIFSLMDAVMLRTLPVHNPQELVFLAHGQPNPGASSNYPLFERYRSLEHVFSGITAFSPTAFKLKTSAGLENVTGLWVNGSFHAVLGVPMALGRGFAGESDRPTSAPAAVISDAFWLRKFGRDPGILERSLTLDGRVVPIVGVTAPEFTGMIPGSSPDVTLPLAVRTITNPRYLTMHDTWTDLTIVGRLAPGVTVDAALAPVDAAFQQYMSEPENAWIKKSNPAAFANAALVPAARGSGVLRRQYETALTILMGMVAVVLLIASVNVANLMLVRSAARAKEVAIRMCVGGGRSRLIRQFLTESVLLAAAGGALGLVFANWGTAAVMSLFNAAESPLVLDVSLNVRVLAFTMAITVVTGVAFGLVPAFASTRVDLTPALKDAIAKTSRRRWSMSDWLVGGQVALSIVVLAIAALLARTLYNLKTLDAGFDAGNLLLVTIDTNGTPVPVASRLPLFAEILERVEQLPGVQMTSGSTSSPIHTSGNARALVMPPGTRESIDDTAAFTNNITPDYFETLGIRHLRGRLFNELDSATSPRVAIVNETMARFWAGDQDPIGKTISFRGDPKQQIAIVGVVEDTRQMNLRDAPLRTVYVPITQAENVPSAMQMAIRTSPSPATIVPAVRSAIRNISADVVIRYVRTIDQQIDASLVRERVLAMLSAGFALLALVLSAIGLYGVMSYSVTRRSREIGIRMALGAARSRVVGQVLAHAMIIAAAGTVAGTIAALLATRTLSTFLFGLSERDPVTLFGVSVSLITVAFVAGALPARRAAALNPVQAIKAE
ncbi:MAG TPA: ABC transporter permease [Vicinamibacterales bacterium]|nr:ABC transporter permease [Vicinamibacterales bacterium]